METFHSASALIAARKPEKPIIGLRPHAAGRAARWFLENFPGDVAYAYKANSTPFLIGALYGAGIRHFDVASLPELEDAKTIPDVTFHFMHPVKSRHAIRRGVDKFLQHVIQEAEDGFHNHFVLMPFVPCLGIKRREAAHRGAVFAEMVGAGRQ